MKTVLKLVISISIFAILNGCAANGPFSYERKIPYDNLDNYIVDIVGSDKPKTVKLAPLYKEKYTRKIPNYKEDTTFTCNGSRMLSYDRDLTISEIKGNELSGTISSINSCGSTSTGDIVGRFNDNLLAYHWKSNSDQPKYIYTFKILNNGRILADHEVYSFKTTGRYVEGKKIVDKEDFLFKEKMMQSGETYSDGDIYHTTNFIAQVDASTLNNATEPTLSLKDKLNELKSLYEEGLLTKKEYNAKRKALLDTY